MSHLIGRSPVEAFALEIDGQTLSSHWRLLTAREVNEPSENMRHGIAELVHEVRPIGVTIHTRVDDSQFLERWIDIKNRGTQPVVLGRIAPMGGLLWYISDYAERATSANVFELGYFANSSFGFEGDFQWRVLGPGVTRLTNDTGRSGWGIPYFIVRNHLTGESFIAHLEWATNWFMEFTVEQGRSARAQSFLTPYRDAALYFSMGPYAPYPQRILAPGETISSPIVHLGQVHGNLDDCVALLHRHLRESVLAPQVSGRELLVGSGMVVAGDETWLKREIDLAHRLGMEYFFVDAGWYGNEFGQWYDTVGDWNVGPWLREGLEPIRKHIHDRGMLFGLWMEPESIGSRSKLLEQHPDWVMQRDGSPVGQGRLLDWSKPEVREWIEAAIVGVIEQLRPDLFKIDYNTKDIAHEGESLQDGYLENTQWRHTEGLYAVLDRIRSRFPKIVFENCAAGGGRNDLGMVRRFQTSAHSDYTVIPRSLKALNNLTLAYPPHIFKYYFGHWPSYHMYGDVDFQLRTTLFANPIFVGFGRAEDLGEHLEHKIRKYVALYRDFVRPMLPKCRVYHHTGVLPLDKPTAWCVIEYASEDSSKVLVGLFRLNEGAPTEYCFQGRGLNPGYRYRVTQGNSNITYDASGRDLITDGIPVRLESELSSELLCFERLP